MSESLQTHTAVLMFSDLVDSVGIQNRCGTTAYAGLLSRHNVLFQQAVVTNLGGRILQKTGDGFLVEFNSSAAAVRAALLFQRLMARESWGTEKLQARVAIHAGEVSELAGVTGGIDHVGMGISLAARLLDLASSSQILLSKSVFDEARREVQGPSSEDDNQGGASIRWAAHGRYLFKGVEDPAEVFEVGEEGIGPLLAPADSAKAKRHLDAGELAILGWRPAAGQRIPRKEDWLLVRRLGEGGFGEVWLAEHKTLKELRVFKFCFDADRLRSFRREVALFRLLRDVLGNREDIARIYDVQSESAPFYLESEYGPEGSLEQWCQRSGGLASIAFEKRLRLFIRVATALGMAHSVGVIHRDIKPSNILVVGQDGEIKPRLADFGIGELVDRSVLASHNISGSGFTQVLPTKNESSRTGTRLYAPPEYATGAPPSIQGDIYSLGVLLFQLTIADFSKPLGQGWERLVPDPLVREDIAKAIDVEPLRRFQSAAEFARSLEDLPQRRLQLAWAEREKEDAKRLAWLPNFRRRTKVALIVLALLGIAAAGVFAAGLQYRWEASGVMICIGVPFVLSILGEKRFNEVENAFLAVFSSEMERLTASNQMKLAMDFTISCIRLSGAIGSGQGVEQTDSRCFRVTGAIANIARAEFLLEDQNFEQCDYCIAEACRGVRRGRFREVGENWRFRLARVLLRRARVVAAFGLHENAQGYLEACKEIAENGWADARRHCPNPTSSWPLILQEVESALSEKWEMTAEIVCAIAECRATPGVPASSDLLR